MSERSPTSKSTYQAIPFIQNIQNRQIHDDRKTSVGQRWKHQGAGDRGGGNKGGGNRSEG